MHNTYHPESISVQEETGEHEKTNVNVDQPTGGSGQKRESLEERKSTTDRTEKDSGTTDAKRGESSDDPSRLPIEDYKDQLIDLVYKNVVTVVCGETGCGKTTKIPQFLNDSPKIRALVKSWNKTRDVPRDMRTNDQAVKTQDKQTREQEPETPVPVEGTESVIVQPHRIAAISVAKRVAAERGSELGQEVGYTVRWDSVVTPGVTKIKYVTDGILVKECTRGEDQLLKYDVVVIDEAHERSLNVDVLLALIKRLIHRRQGNRPADLPVRFIVTSATLDIEKFCAFFDNCPSLIVPGRQFPVSIRNVPVKSQPDDDAPGIYVPQGDESDGDGKDDTKGETKGDGKRRKYDFSKRRRKQRRIEEAWISPDAAVSAAVALSMRIHAETPVTTGHILCFLSGAAECERAVKALHETLQQTEREVSPALVLPLYGTLDASQQANIFIEVKPGTRKIVFATNVAETSLTVPGIGHIVDSGIVKQTFFHSKTGIVALNRVPVSKTQANQRAGRAGRTMSGVCWRLYSEETYNTFADQTVPEILRCDPSAAVLNLLTMNIRDLFAIEFLDAPNKLSIALALKELALLDAIDPHTLRVTPVGRAMSVTPLDPIYGRCLVEALTLDVVPELAAILALLSTEQLITTPNPRLLQMQQGGDGGGDDEEEDEAEHDPSALAELFILRHKTFRDDDSDHITLLNIYNQWLQRRGNDPTKLLNKERLYGWCIENFLSMRSLITAERVQQQLIDLMTEVESAVTGGKGEVVPSPETSLMRRKERVLRALCAGCFVNTAKLHISGSLKGGVPMGAVVKGWTSVKEGIVLKPHAQSVLTKFVPFYKPPYYEPFTFSQDEPPTWILYDQITAIGTNPGSSNVQGSMRVGSAIDYTWVNKLLPKIHQITLDDLIDAVENPWKRRKAERRGRDENFGDRSLTTDNRKSTTGHADGSGSAATNRDETEKQKKIAAARERMLARKKT